LRTLHRRQLAALEHEDAIGTFGEDALHRAPRPVLVPGSCESGFGQFGTTSYGPLKTSRPAFISRDRAEAGIRGLTLNRPRRFADDDAGDQRAATVPTTKKDWRMAGCISFIQDSPRCRGVRPGSGMCGRVYVTF
jgi:hypothetical protein